MRVLFVCTANMCRSPMAAALFRRRVDWLEEACVRQDVTVTSAGLLDAGHPPPAEVVAVMAGLGIDLSGHRSTQLDVDLVSAADLVVGMARRHAREVVLLESAAWPRTLTLKDLVRRGEKVGPRQAREGLSSWLDHLHEGRDRMDLVGRAPEDDVADPLGGPQSAYAAAARELGNLVDRVAALLWPPPPTPPRPR
jgi:protein-tyrosine phosphatase